MPPGYFRGDAGALEPDPASATGGATIYIDGVASTVQVSPATQLADTAFALTFGSSAANATNFDEFALYDQTLTAGRVSAHYAAAGGV